MARHLTSIERGGRAGLARAAGSVLGLLGGFILGYAMVRSSGIRGGGRVIISMTTLEGLIFAYLSTPYLVAGWRDVDRKLKATPLIDLLAGLLGLVAGLVVAILVGYFVRAFPYGVPVSAGLAGVLGLAGGSLGMHRREELVLLLTGRAHHAEQKRLAAVVLDTSVIIDGRILELTKTGFLDMAMVVPRCVLKELQLLADASEETRRGKGRRGLEVLTNLQRDTGARLEFLDEDPDGSLETDAKLVRLARRSGSGLLTNDYNLDRVARLEGVTVLNLNQLATALRPLAMPGEEISLEVIREGRSAGQGVGYLEDGTMVVVEGGRPHLDETVRVTVTSVLQTPAGRMIFAQAPNGRGPRQRRRQEAGLPAPPMA